MFGVRRFYAHSDAFARARMTDPHEVGAAVLDVFARGREKRHEEQRQQSALIERLVAQYAAQEIARGKTSRGRAGRIAVLLRGFAKRRTIQKYLARQEQRCQLPEAASAQPMDEGSR